MALEGELILVSDDTTVDFILTRVDMAVQNTNFNTIAIPLTKSKQDTETNVNKIIDLKRIVQTYSISGLLNSETGSSAFQKLEALVAQIPGGDFTGDTVTNPIIGSPAKKGILMRLGPLKFSWRRNEDGSKKTFVDNLFFKDFKAIDDVKRPPRTTILGTETASTFDLNEPEFIQFTVVLVRGEQA